MLCKNVMLSTLYEGLIFYIYYLKALYGAKACPQLLEYQELLKMRDVFGFNIIHLTFETNVAF